MKIFKIERLSNFNRKCIRQTNILKNSLQGVHCRNMTQCAHIYIYTEKVGCWCGRDLSKNTVSQVRNDECI